MKKKPLTNMASSPPKGKPKGGIVIVIAPKGLKTKPGSKK